MMKKTILLFAALLALPTWSFGIEITHGPYICDMDSTSVTIMWTTDKPGMSWVELGETGSDHFYGEERQKYFATLHGRKLVRDTVHQVRIGRLKPNTSYRYRIATKELTGWTWSDYTTYGRTAASVVYRKDPYVFKIFPVGKRDAKFLVLNDIHQRAAYMTDLCKDINFKEIDFVVLNGDMSNMIEDHENIFVSYMDSLVSMCATSTPIIMNRGNHETRGKFADYLERYFPTPSGKFYQLRTFFGIDYLFIDSGEDKPDSDIEYSEIADYDNYRLEQMRWLQDLQAKALVGKRPLVVFSHIPPGVGDWHGQQHLQRTILPELNKMNVSVMFSGHTHRYFNEKANELVHFPNLVNNHLAYLLCHVTDGKIEVECAELNGKNKKHFTYPLK